MRALLLPLLCALTLSAAAQTPGVVEIHVAVDGDDRADGSQPRPASGHPSGPVATLARAQALARARRDDAPGGVHVVIGPGTYRLSAPLVFGPQDSGTEGAPTVYRASTPGSVVLSGGRVLQLTDPASASRPARFEPPHGVPASTARGATQLYVDGQRATLARMPDAGQYAFVEQPVDLPDERPGENGRTAFVPRAPESEFFRRLTSEDRQRAVVHLYQSWSVGRHRIAAATPGGAGVQLAPRTRWPFLHFGLNQRYFVENVAAAFDAPGEWIWDDRGVLYRPLAGQVGRTLGAVMPMLDELVGVRGDIAAKRWVHDLEFRGLTFAHARLLTAPQGELDLQAGVAIGAAVTVDGARRIAFDDCRVTQVGGFGLWLRESVRESRVARAVIEDVGGGGVKIGLPTQPPGAADGTGGNAVTDSIVRDTGRLVPGAAAIWIGQSFDNTIDRNLVARTTYTAISAGWTWGQGSPTSGRNRITRNLLVDIGQSQLADLGGIYTLGESPGTVIAANVVRNVRTFSGYSNGAAGWGIYSDEGTSGVSVERNVVYGSSSGGYHLHFGSDNEVVDNVFASGEEAEIRLPARAAERRALRLSGNLLLPGGPALFADPQAGAPGTSFEGNVAAPVRAAAAPALRSACAGRCVVDDVAIDAGADARSLALRGSAAPRYPWFAGVVAAAGPPDIRTVPVKPTAAPPKAPAPALDVHLDFSRLPEGFVPARVRKVDGSAGGRIAIGRTGKSTPNCLRFEDVPSPVRRWEPFAYLEMNHASGRTVARFELEPQPGSVMVHEWRDRATPALVGPSLRMTSEGIEAAGRRVVDLAPGEPALVTITVDMDRPTSGWDLQVDTRGGQRRVAALPMRDAQWRSLDWLGFIADADERAVACLRRLDVVNAATR